jgi:uncharacterized protein YacL
MSFFRVHLVPQSGIFGGLIGSGLGILFAGFLIAFDHYAKKFSLRTLNNLTLGLFVGLLLGVALNLIFEQLVSIGFSANVETAPQSDLLKMIRVSIFLFATFLGTMMVIRSTDELHLSIPFVRLTPVNDRRQDLIVDVSALADPRLVDLCSTGVFDHRLILPRFLLRDLHIQVEHSDEAIRFRAKKALDVAKKLEEMSSLQLRFHQTDFPETKDPLQKLQKLARSIGATILCSDQSKIQLPTQQDGIFYVNICSLSQALKPLMQAGETLRIKIQRFGKEPLQGVGYLEDGTMVVVNGGGAFVGEVIQAQVLSVKHTQSGRMIFCNTLDGEHFEKELPLQDAGEYQHHTS